MSAPLTEHQSHHAVARTHQRAWRGLGTALTVALGLILLRFAVQLGAFLWFALRCPYEVDYGEGILLHYALNMSQGLPIYTDYHRYPFLAATYPPVYPFLCALGVKLFGITYAFGRALSILSTVGVTILIWAMLRRVPVSRFAAGFGAMLFLAAPLVCLRGVLLRVDMVAVFLGMAGLYCVMRGGRWLVPAVLLLALAVYTRQSQIAPVAASVAYLWWSRQRREAWWVAAGWGALTLAAFLALQLLSHGWFFRHVITANQNLWEMEGLVEVWRAALAWPMPFLLGLVGAGLTLAARPAQSGDRGADSLRGPEWLMLWYFGFALLSSLTAGKIGAYVNYMLEPEAAAALMAGVGYQRLVGSLRSPSWTPAWVGVWLLLVGPSAGILAQPHRAIYGPYPFYPEAIVQTNEDIAPLVRETRGDILSEDVGMLVTAGREVWLDPHKMSSMSRDGTWDQRVLVRDIRRRRFTLILTTWNPGVDRLDRWGLYGGYRWTKDMGVAIRRNYYVIKYSRRLYALAPADNQHPSCERLLLGSGRDDRRADAP